MAQEETNKEIEAKNAKLQAEIDVLVAEIEERKAKVSELRKQKRKILDNTPRCRNCANCEMYYLFEGTASDCRCKVSITKYGTGRVVSKSMPACIKYQKREPTWIKKHRDHTY